MQILTLNTLRPIILRVAFVVFFIGNATFGVQGQSEELLTKYRDGFWKSYRSNSDSALIYARKLVKLPGYEPFLREALQQDAFSSFLDVTKQKLKAKVKEEQQSSWENYYLEEKLRQYKTLTKLYESKNNELVNNVKPLYIFASVDLNIVDSLKVSDLTKSLISYIASQKNLYQSSAATYGLFVYRIIEKDKRYEKLADELISSLVSVLAVKQLSGQYNGYTQELRERAWYRYVVACANYFKGIQLSRAGSTKEALKYYRTAAEYSADLTDLNNNRGFRTEAITLPEATSNRIYMAYLKQLIGDPASKDETLKALSQMAFRNPIAYKEQLRTFYTETNPVNGDFSSYWNNLLNSQLSKSPTFKIKGIDGTKYSSVTSGKWKLIDFWGTWCGPCREEHPILEKLFVERDKSFFNNIELITIACQDEEENVENYQKLFRYTFPVAMSDGRINQLFNVTTFPTKVLMSPEGNSMTIPYGIDWVNYVKAYVSK
ncbi:MAG: TlpA disulfide reductase family protein [Pedobacter sp.]